MNIEFISLSENTGDYNMSLDLRLAEVAGKGRFFLRFYRWNPYCISLGALQKQEEIDNELAKKDNIDITRRPTGGRAIFHSEEITYSIACPTSFGISAKQLYEKASRAIIKGLAYYDSRLKSLELAEEHPNFFEALKKNTGSICFANSAKNEIKFKDKKVVGSAQRKFNNSLLQHGSIICGPKHMEITKYLNLDEEQKKNAYEEMKEKTISLSEILDKDVSDYEVISECLLKGFHEEFKIDIKQIEEKEI